MSNLAKGRVWPFARSGTRRLKVVRDLLALDFETRDAGPVFLHDCLADFPGEGLRAAIHIRDHLALIVCGRPLKAEIRLNFAGKLHVVTRGRNPVCYQVLSRRKCHASDLRGSFERDLRSLAHLLRQCERSQCQHHGGDDCN